MKISIKFSDDEEEKAKLGYQTATQLVKILNHEIYSRYYAMLTANSIIIAGYGFIFSERINLPETFKMLLPFLGIILCIFWIIFVYTGIYRQRQYREVAKKLEETYFKNSFHLFRVDYPKDPFILKCFRFYLISIYVIFIFIIVHLLMLLYAYQDALNIVIF